MGGIWRGARLLARKRGLAILAVGLFAFAANAAVTALVRVPVPWLADEFSYLLGADTFARGRLQNPTHPFWVHFESMHVIHQPTYASKYPPGQGLILAAGQVLGGHPIVGVWLATALACASLCWMFQAFLPPRWALLGGLLTALHPTIMGWTQSYLGGSLAACGGALVIGAARRLAAFPRARDSVWGAIGAAILANTRPFEGFVVTVLAGAALGLALLRGNMLRDRRVIARIVLPGGALLALAAAAMAYYNAAITGSALRMPYMVHEAAYAVAPPFLWQRPRPVPAYHHQALRDLFTGLVLEAHTKQRCLPGFLQFASMKLYCMFLVFYPNAITQIPLLLLPWVWRRKWMRLATGMLAVFAAVLLTETWLHSHYLAPVLGLALLLEFEGLRRLATLRVRGSAVGRRAVGALALGWPVLFCLGAARLPQADGLEPVRSLFYQRAEFARSLERQGGRHLIFVRYATGHDPQIEWVYNGADLERSPVVWARDMGAVCNQKLVEYERGRKVWLVQADRQPLQIVPYSAQRQVASGREDMTCPGTP